MERTTVICAILSDMVGIPKGRVPPFDFGISDVRDERLLPQPRQNFFRRAGGKCPLVGIRQDVLCDFGVHGQSPLRDFCGGSAGYALIGRGDAPSFQAKCPEGDPAYALSSLCGSVSDTERAMLHQQLQQQQKQQ